jgi:hypothetical protein
MINTLEMIKSEYGGVESYVKTVCGLSEDDIAAVRRRMLIHDEHGDAKGWRWAHVSRL